MKEYYVYILKCSDNSFYTGVTNNCELRLSQHEEGKESAYTYSRRPVKLVYKAEFRDIDQAIAWEKQVKRWSRRKKEVLIEGNYEELPELSKKKIFNRSQVSS